MPRCRSCLEIVTVDRDRTAARCPHCREPLYEHPDAERRMVRSDDVAFDSKCAEHPGSNAVALCQRCGNYLCAVCRTIWRSQCLCVSCVNRNLEEQEATPEEARAHLRQAALGVVFGLTAWLVTLAAFVFVSIAVASDANPVVIGLGGLVVLGSPLPSMLGVGQAAAAIRARGSHMILATLGLILSGMHAGLVIGLLAFSLWNN